MTTIQIKLQNCLDLIFASPILLYRLFRFGYTYRRIYLGEDKWTLLDVKDYYRLLIFKWIIYGNGTNLYAVRHQLIEPNKTKTVYMHREIMNPPAGLVVDHRNCDGLDNRKDNLRFATHAQNTRNRRKKKNGSSQFLGVYFNKEKSTWDSQLRHNEKRIWVGRFKTEIDAARAYDAAARKYHGEFARLNFPEAATPS
ncbi:MAG: HNH endonuclease [Sedimentisphaerales bacterium]